MQARQRVVERTGDRRQAAQPERVLQPRRVDGAAVSTRMRRADGDQPGQRPGRPPIGAANASRLPASASERERGDAEPGVEQLAQSAHASVGARERRGVRAHERRARPRPQSRAGTLSLQAPAPSCASTREVARADAAEVAQLGSRPSRSRPTSASATSGRCPPAAGGHLGEPDERSCRARPRPAADSPIPPAWLRSSRMLCARPSPVLDLDVAVGADTRSCGRRPGCVRRSPRPWPVGGGHALAGRRRQLHVQRAVPRRGGERGGRRAARLRCAARRCGPTQPQTREARP